MDVRRGLIPGVEEHLFDEEELEARARDGDVDALCCWAEQVAPVDYDELGWAD